MRATRTSNQSIVRRGNHFIRIDDKWVLIDGPWFDQLSGYGERFVELVCPVTHLASMEETCDPGVVTYHYTTITWKRVSWVNGVYLDWDRLYTSSFVRARLMMRRYHYGFMVYPDGRLPAYLNRPDEIDDEYTSERLVKMGY